MTEPKYFSGAVFMLKLIFLYPVDTKSIIKKSLYFSWVFLYFLTLATIFIQSAIYLYKTPFDLIDESLVIMNIAIYFSLFVNFTFLYVKKVNLAKFVENINENFIDESDNFREKVTMIEASKLSDKFAYYWSVNCVVSSLMPTATSLIGGNRILPIKAWFPYDITESPNFELTYIWQVICVANLGINYAVLDLVFPCISLLMAQQFKILCTNLENSFVKALSETDLSVERFMKNQQNGDSNEEIYKISKNEDFHEKNLNYLKKNIRHYQFLLNLCENINDILSNFLLGKISAAIFNTVFIAFSIITSGDVAMIFGLGSYVISTSIELLIYTYSGQILTENADNVMWALYKNPWYCCDLKFQKVVQLVQIRASKTVYIRAGKYFTMTAAAYITFMKALGSYIAVLKELTDRRK